MSIKICGECGQQIQNDASYKAWRESIKTEQPVQCAKQHEIDALCRELDNADS